jgi:hypothetical protein
MVALAASAAFLTPSLAMVAPPASVDVRVVLTLPPAAPAMVVADLSPRARQKSLGEVVNEVVRGQLAAEPAPALVVPVVDDRIADDGSFDPDQAVVTAHDERIGLLRRTLAEAPTSTLPQHVADLRKRLVRAEAARRLALARIEGHRPLGTTATLMAAAAPVSAISAMRLSRPAIARVSGANPVARPHLADVDRHGGTPTAALLAHARHALGTARAALTSPVPPRPAIQLAGLMSWPGSDRWSLPARSIA